MKMAVAAGCLVTAIAVMVGWLAVTGPEHGARAALRRDLLAAIQPVRITNCDFARAGDDGDGGYVYCRNLLEGASAVYSYGIAGTDQWGCDMSAALQTPVHEYDCFDDRRPTCGHGTPVFHSECVGPRREDINGRPFDSIAGHIERNGDAGKRLMMKIDVEGAEWQSLLATPDETLRQINQVSIEFHIPARNLTAKTAAEDREKYLGTLRKLKALFYVANVHFNNWVCEPGYEPLPGWAFEVLLVNRDLAQVDPGAPVPPNPLDMPNTTSRPDCKAPLLNRNTGADIPDLRALGGR